MTTAGSLRAVMSVSLCLGWRVGPRPSPLLPPGRHQLSLADAEGSIAVPEPRNRSLHAVRAWYSLAAGAAANMAAASTSEYQARSSDGSATCEGDRARAEWDGTILVSDTFLVRSAGHS